MQTYVINLDRSPERLQFVQNQAQSRGIEFERVSAVDGRELSEEELAACVAPRFEFQPINAGEIGLFMSHKRVWQMLLNSGLPYAAVFEDDVVLSPTIRSTFDAIDEHQPVFDVIKLETTLRRVVCCRSGESLRSGDRLQRLLSWHGGTAGYVISANCAKRLLIEKTLLADPIDQVMFNPISLISSRMKILQLTPAACIQKDILEKDAANTFGTTLDRNTSKGQLFRHGPIIDIRRLINKQRESHRRRQLARQPENVQLVIPFVNESELRRVA